MEMASADIFSSVASPSVPPSIKTPEPILNGLSETVVEPLTINDIKMFESLDLDSSGSSGIGNSNEAIIEGSLDEDDSLLEENQHCKICKYVNKLIYSSNLIFPKVSTRRKYQLPLKLL